MTTIIPSVNPPVQYISFDPGGTTGVIYGTLRGRDDFTVDGVYPFYYEDRNSALHYLFSLQTYGLVIYEDFRIFKRAAHMMVGSVLQAVRLIGAIEYCTYIYSPSAVLVPLQPIVKTNQKVKRDDLPKLKINEHCRDAYYLLRYYSLITFQPASS